MVVDRDDLMNTLLEINRRLEKKRLRGEIVLYNDSALSIVKEKTEPVGGIEARYYPKNEIEKMFNSNGLKELFDSRIRAYMSKNEKLLLYKQLSYLDIYVALPKYVLAMKIRMARCSDLQEIKQLLEKLNIIEVKQLEDIVFTFYLADEIDERMIDEVEYRFMR